MVRDTIINHLVYADDLVVLFPVMQYHIKLNSKKSVVIIAKTKDDHEQNFPVQHFLWQTKS